MSLEKILIIRITEITFLGSFQSGQMGQTVNLLVFTFGGSNPSLPTKIAEVAQLIEH